MYWIVITIAIFACAFLLIRGVYSHKDRTPENKRQGVDESSAGVGDSEAEQ